MSAPTDWIDKRLVNALYTDARLGGAAGKLLGSGGRAGVGMVEKAMGGLWVGGTAYLTAHSVEFHANALNRAVQATGTVESVVLPLSKIEELGYRKATMTHIVDLATDTQTLSIRGYTMRSFHKAISEAVAAARI